MIINKFVVHVLDKNNDCPILADFEGKIDLGVDKFLQKTIKKILKDDDIRKAKFNNYNENIVKECCEQMLYDETTFLENSKEIASYMFDVMRVNPDITSGNLGICLFTNKDNKYVAIIKFDYKKLYTHTIEFVDDKFNIQMVPNEIGVSETQKPKQCAIVGFSGVNDEYHLRVLDKNFEKQEIDSIFIKEFLNIEKIKDDKYNTKTFKNTTETFITNILSSNVKEAESMREILNYELKESNELNINEFAEKAIKSTEIKQDFIEWISDKDLDTNFEVDKRWVEKNLKKRKIKTDTNFEITGDISNFEDPMKYSIKTNPNGTIDITIKNVNFYE